MHHTEKNNFDIVTKYINKLNIHLPGDSEDQ